jgi:hypothetical protein
MNQVMELRIGNSKRENSTRWPEENDKAYKVDNRTAKLMEHWLK